MDQLFFKGDRVEVTYFHPPGEICLPESGKIFDTRKTFVGLGGSRQTIVYYIQLDKGSKKSSYMASVTLPGIFLKSHSGKKCFVTRANPRELNEDFVGALEQELSLVRQLAQEPDETKRAGALATLRNLTRYLSTEIDAAYVETERLARETDETGRAAVLATLRNLNVYLTDRQKK